MSRGGWDNFDCNEGRYLFPSVKLTFDVVHSGFVRCFKVRVRVSFRVSTFIVRISFNLFRVRVRIRDKICR